MKPITFISLILDQQFKISRPDENIIDFIIDCNSGLCCWEDNNSKSQILFNGIG